MHAFTELESLLQKSATGIPAKAWVERAVKRLDSGFPRKDIDELLQGPESNCKNKTNAFVDAADPDKRSS